MVAPTRRQKRCGIALLVDIETGEHDRHGRFVPDAKSMEEEVLKCLRRSYESVNIVPCELRIEETARDLRKLKPRLVFNLTEWLDGDRRLDAAIAGMLDAIKIPYTGTGPVGMHLARDKALSKAIVASLGITVPRHVIVDGRRTHHGDLRFPLIVKPQFGDGSDEIANSSIVHSPREFVRRAHAVRRRVKGPVIVEEYVPGTDLFVGLLGNEPRVLKPLEMVVGRRGAGAPSITTCRIKMNAAYRARWKIGYRTARLPRSVARTVEQASIRIFHALKLRDYARIDYRLTPDHELVFLEANPNPDLSPHTFGENQCFAGVAYADLINGIVDSALGRAHRRAD